MSGQSLSDLEQLYGKLVLRDIPINIIEAIESNTSNISTTELDSFELKSFGLHIKLWKSYLFLDFIPVIVHNTNEEFKRFLMRFGFIVSRSRQLPSRISYDLEGSLRDTIKFYLRLKEAGTVESFLNRLRLHSSI